MISQDFIQSILDDDIQNGIINGGAVLVATPDREILGIARGFATNDHAFPMTLDTVIDGASTTKVVAGITALLILRDRGLIDFDRPFTDYLPAYSAQLPQPITIRELANHLSGYMIGSPAYGRELFDNYTGKRLLDFLLSTPPTAPRQPHAHYSCWNYHLLAQVIQNITGQRLDNFCMNEIFRPLHMDDTCLGTPRPGIPAERIAQTMDTPAPGIISDAPANLLWRDGFCTVNAGLFSTARDYAKLLACYLNHGDPIFSPQTAQECAPDTRDQTDGYRNLGWVVWDNHSCQEAFGTSLLHSGWSGQTIVLDYKRNIAIVVLTTRCGDYEKAKCDRFAIINHIFQNFQA